MADNTPQPDTSPTPTPSPAGGLQSGRWPEGHPMYEAIAEDVRRHRVMLGHPPEGPIFQQPSDEEIRKRIERLRKPTPGFQGLIRPAPTQNGQQR